MKKYIKFKSIMPFWIMQNVTKLVCTFWKNGNEWDMRSSSEMIIKNVGGVPMYSQTWEGLMRDWRPCKKGTPSASFWHLLILEKIFLTGLIGILNQKVILWIPMSLSTLDIILLNMIKVKQNLDKLL